MKSILKRALAAAAMVAAIGTGVANAAELEVTVPFQFEANGKTMAAGHYIVEQAAGSNVVYLRNTRNGNGVFVNVHAANGAESSTLTFSSNASGYELTAVGSAPVASAAE